MSINWIRTNRQWRLNSTGRSLSTRKTQRRNRTGSAGRQRPWSRIAVDDSHQPFDGSEVHLLDADIVHSLILMSEGRIEDTALAVLPGPDDGKIIVRAKLR